MGAGLDRLGQGWSKWYMSGVGVSTQLCGNWLVEGDEDCDSGPGGDDCCDSTCVLRVNASCRWVCQWVCQ